MGELVSVDFRRKRKRLDNGLEVAIERTNARLTEILEENLVKLKKQREERVRNNARVLRSYRIRR